MHGVGRSGGEGVRYLKHSPCKVVHGQCVHHNVLCNAWLPSTKVCVAKWCILLLCTRPVGGLHASPSQAVQAHGDSSLACAQSSPAAQNFALMSLHYSIELASMHSTGVKLLQFYSSQQTHCLLRCSAYALGSGASVIGLHPDPVRHGGRTWASRQVCSPLAAVA